MEYLYHGGSARAGGHSSVGKSALLHKLENLTSDPQKPHKKSGVATDTPVTPAPTKMDCWVLLASNLAPGSVRDLVSMK